MGILAISALLVAGTGFFLFSKSLPNYRPGNKKIQRDLQLIRGELDKLQLELAPLDKDDLETLSTNQVHTSRKRGLVKSFQGVFTSIFEEPLFAYHYRHYISQGDGLLLVRTHQYEIYFWQRAKGVKIVINDQLLGDYDPQTGNLYGGKQRQPIAQLVRDLPDQMPMLIQGREVANLARTDLTGKGELSKRVFEYTKNDLSREEEAVVIAITAYDLVLRSVEG